MTARSAAGRSPAGTGVADSAGPLAEPDVAIPGCPPGPVAITQALRALTGR